MNKKSSNLFVTLSCILVLATTMSVFGFACSEMQTTKSASMDGNQDFGSELPILVSSAGVPILTQAYSSLATALQVNAPSTTSRDEFLRQSGSLSDTGQPSSVSAAFVLSFETLGAQLCLDRISFENVTGNTKVLFNSLNLAAAPAGNVTPANLQVVINRIARAVWQRNETDAERDLLTTAVMDSMALDTVNNANKTQEAALFLCTAMVASLSGMQQ